MQGDVLIRDGKIVAVGKGIDIPSDAKRIDVKGMHVTPGLIDVRSSLWLTAAAAREGASNGSLNAVDGIDLFSEDWREVARQGVTTVYVQPGPSGLLGGAGVVLRVAPAGSLESLTITSDAGAQASLGVGGKTGTSRDRYAQYVALKKVLEAAKKYDDEWKAYEEYEAKQKKKEADKKDGGDKDTEKKDAAKKDGEKKDAAKPAKKEASDDKAKKPTDSKTPASKTPATKTGDDKSKEEKKPESKSAESKKDASDKDEKPPTKPKRDVAKDFLRKAIQGKLPLRLEAHREDDIANALKLAEEMKVRIVLEGASTPDGSQEELLDSRVPLVLGPFVESGSPPAFRARREHNWAAPLAREDARWAIATFSTTPRGSRLLRVHAAMAVATGIKPNLALRAITHDAARILGIDQQAGSISKGKRADLAVFAGHPLDPSAPVALTMSGGEISHQADASALASSDASASPLPDVLPTNYAVRSDRVLRNGKLTPATLMIRNGKIAAIRGRDAEVKNMPAYDVGAAVITPGLISANCGLGQDSLVDDEAEVVAPDIRVADAFDPSLPQWSDFAEAGFLTVGFSPGSANVVSGHSALVATAGDEQRATIEQSPAALQIVLTSASRRTSRYPASLAGQTELVRRVFDGDFPATRLLLPEEVETQLMKARRQAIADARSGKRRVLFRASEPAEVRAAIDLIQQFGLQATIVYPNELEPVIDDLRRLKIGVIAKPVSAGDYDRYLTEVGRAAAAGVEIAFAGESPEACRMSASLAASLGMPRPAALDSLTTSAAKLAGAAKSTGRLEAKQEADFVVWNGSPLDLCRKPISIVVAGQRARIK